MDWEQGWTCGAWDQGWVSTREEGESRFPERPSTPGSWQKSGPVEFPSCTPKPGAPRVPTEGACPGEGHEMAVPHCGAAAHTARLGGSGVLWCLSPVLPQLAVAFTALGLFWVPQNQALRLTEDTSSANNRWVSWRAAGFSCWFCGM